MSEANRYLTSWERFWGTLTGAQGEVFWDSNPADAAQQDCARLRDYADLQLPLIDVGCGNGTQTRFFADHFAKVIGTEIAPAAVEVARTQHSAPNLSYRLLDLLSPDDAQALHEEIGDAHVYVRAVLHQLSSADQPTAVQSIERLLGAKGTLYLLELSSAAETYFAGLIKQYGAPPPGLARVFQHGITPGKLNDLGSLFPADRFTLLRTGESHIHTTNTLPTGEVAKVPAFYAILRRR
jgi:SAM-dependent methyltransferase